MQKPHDIVTKVESSAINRCRNGQIKSCGHLHNKFKDITLILLTLYPTAK